MKLLMFVTLFCAAASSHAGGERLYASCAACHGTAGAGVKGVLPTLAGQPKGALADSMRAFKAGTRPATIMHQIAKGYTEAQIEQIAAYLAAQPAEPRK
ncbi:MAG: c-type cytochrome [Pseudomonadota bacterium]